MEATAQGQWRSTEMVARGFSRSARRLVAAVWLGSGGDGNPTPVRRKLPDERQSITHKFVIGNHEGYIHVGLYP